MKTQFKMAVGAALASAMAVPAQAATVYITSLSGASVVAPVASAGQGSAIMTIDTALSTLTVTAVFFGLNGKTTGAGLHCCVAPGSNGPVAINMAGFPLASFAGGYGHVFNLTAGSTYTAGFLAGNGGNALTARTALMAGLASGKAYLNLRTVPHPTGELRGQMMVVSAVPEPSEWALLVVGVMLTGSMLRKQARMRQRVRYVLA